MTKTYGFLAASVAVIVVLAATGPTLIALLEAAVPLAVVVGLVVATLRVVWYVTDRFR